VESLALQLQPCLTGIGIQWDEEGWHYRCLLSRPITCPFNLADVSHKKCSIGLNGFCCFDLVGMLLNAFVQWQQRRAAAARNSSR
jgi:hypothetical protein